MLHYHGVDHAPWQCWGEKVLLTYREQSILQPFARNNVGECEKTKLDAHFSLIAYITYINKPMQLPKLNRTRWFGLADDVWFSFYFGSGKEQEQEQEQEQELY